MLLVPRDDSWNIRLEDPLAGILDRFAASAFCACTHLKCEFKSLHPYWMESRVNDERCMSIRSVEIPRGRGGTLSVPSEEDARGQGNQYCGRYLGAPCIVTPATAPPKKVPPQAKTVYPCTPGSVGTTLRPRLLRARWPRPPRRRRGPGGGQCVNPYRDRARGNRGGQFFLAYYDRCRGDYGRRGRGECQ